MEFVLGAIIFMVGVLVGASISRTEANKNLNNDDQDLR